MKNRNLFLFAGILVLVFLISFASALTISDKSVTLTNSNPSGTVAVTGDKNFTITNSLPIEQTNSKVKFTLNNLVMGSDGKSATFNVSAQELSKVNFLEDFSTNFVLDSVNPLNPSETDSFQISVSYENTQFCSESASSNLDIAIDDIKITSGFGDDEDFWYPLDKVEVDVNVEYSGGSKDEFVDGQLDWALYTKDGELITDGDEDISDLEDGDDETITISFQLDPEDLNVDTESYVLYVSATGNEDYDDNTKTDKDICVSDSQDVEIRMDDAFVIVNNINFMPETASCDSEIEVTAEVWNIGTDDQEEVSVKVSVDEWNFNQIIEIGDIDSFDKESLELKIKVPRNAQEKSYAVKFWVYDEDNDIYENSEDDSAKFELPLTISGSCSTAPQVAVSASLESGGNAGKPLVVKATITNSGNSLETFNLNVAGYNSFASEAKLDQTSIAVGAGQSKDILITLQINKNVSGEQSFNIEVSSNGNKVLTQPVQLTIQSSGFGITGGIINEGNWYLWGIGALNVILVMIIIIVAIRIARS